ncbi:MAG: hypothetical protein K9L94_04815, partial [Candidatus Omnitrophica bacterium]|nr:hypothetical protein [Candidatus Omnitrophota bacterium]
MLKFKNMEKLLYCKGVSKKEKSPLPFNYIATTSIAKARSIKYPVVIIDYKFIKKRKNGDFSFIKDKVCLLCCESGEKIKLSELKKLGFFG